MLAFILAAAFADIDRVELLCRQYDAAPTRAQLAGANAAPKSALLTLAQNKTKPAWVRARATRALVHFDASAELEAFARSSSDRVLRKAAASVLARADIFALQLDDPEPAVRRAAAAQLARFPAEREKLLARLRKEADDDVRDALVNALVATQ